MIADLLHVDQIGFPKKKRVEDREYLNQMKQLPCVVCGAPSDDPSHVLTRGSGHGHDKPGFVFPMCRRHHTQYEGQQLAFIEAYPQFGTVLRCFGWVWGSLSPRPNGGLWHPEQ